MVAVAAGDAVEAQRQAKLAGNLLNDPPLTLLLEAQAAQLGGDEKAATRYFRAMIEHPEASFLGLRGLLMQALKAGNDSEALRLARQAVTERPRTSWAVSTLLDLELRSGDWPQAEATLKRAEKLKVVESADAKRTRAVLLAEQARTSGDLDAAVARLREAVKLAPDLVPARALLAIDLARAGRGREAARTIEHGWVSSPHAELAAAYAQLDPAEEALARARRFERLAGLNSESPGKSDRARRRQSGGGPVGAGARRVGEGARPGRRRGKRLAAAGAIVGATGRGRRQRSRRRPPLADRRRGRCGRSGLDLRALRHHRRRLGGPLPALPPVRHAGVAGDAAAGRAGLRWRPADHAGAGAAACRQRPAALRAAAESEGAERTPTPEPAEAPVDAARLVN